MESVESIEVGDRGQPSYVLASEARVRMERVGLLFYHRNGPRLFLLSSGSWITPDFFASGLTLREWLGGRSVSECILQALEKALSDLRVKGVLRACKGGPSGAFRPGQPHLGSDPTL